MSPFGVPNHQPLDCLLNRYSDEDHMRDQSSASLTFGRGIHRSPVNYPHKGPVTRKMFPFDDVIMCDAMFCHRARSVCFWRRLYNSSCHTRCVHVIIIVTVTWHKREVIFNHGHLDCLFTSLVGWNRASQNSTFNYIAHSVNLAHIGVGHNGHESVSNLQPHHCLLNRLYRRRSKKTSKLRVADLCAGNSPVIGEIPAQMASNAKNFPIWWRHRVQIMNFRLSVASIWLFASWLLFFKYVWIKYNLPASNTM